MNNTNDKHSNVSRRLALLTLVSAFAVPAISTATTPTDEATTPTIEVTSPVAATDTACGQSTVALEVNVSTGEVYLVDSSGVTLTDNEINVYMDSTSEVLIDIEYSSSEWDVDITPDNEPTESYLTSGGSLRYFITSDYAAYEFVSTEHVSTMMNMTPVVPTIIIKPKDPKPDCPPST